MGFPWLPLAGTLSARIHVRASPKDPDMPGQFLFGGTKNNLGFAEPAATLMYKIVKTRHSGYHRVARPHRNDDG